MRLLIMLVTLGCVGCSTAPMTYEQRVALMGVAAGMQRGAELYAAGARPAPVAYVAAPMPVMAPIGPQQVQVVPNLAAPIPYIR